MLRHLAQWQIGELSRRVGVSVHVLRAWERRYQLLQPARTSGGFRLYGPQDEQRVALMRAHLADGLRPAQAAQATLAALPTPPASDSPARPTDEATRAGSEGGSRALQQAGATFASALETFDEPAAQASFDRLLAGWTVDTVFRDVVVPYLRALGDRWSRHEVTVAQEHFASHVLRGRLGGLSRGWGDGQGPTALLACPPGELHDLPLQIFGVVLHQQGWRIRYLGQDTPLKDVHEVARTVDPSIIVLAATTPEHFTTRADELADLAAAFPLAIAGNGSSREIADACGARHLSLDPVTAAQQLV